MIKLEQLAPWIVCHVLCAGAISSASIARAQEAEFDTAYVRDLSGDLAARFFLSTKYNSLSINSDPLFTDLVFRPNNKINMGFGASYRKLTLNIGFGIPGVNRDDEVRGRTRYIDAQANIHSQRWATNLFAQYFQGYYVPSHSLDQFDWVQDTEQPYREDLEEFNLGVSTMRVLNEERFSYRAAFNQDAWQLRSAGSFLLGGYLTWFAVRADSSLVPKALFDEFQEEDRIRNGDFIDLGVMAGYAHTFVLQRHWYVSLSGALGGGLSHQRITAQMDDGEERRNVWGPGWHVQLRSAVGYANDAGCFSIGYNQEDIRYVLPTQNAFAWGVGNIRVNVVQRLRTKVPALDRQLKKIKKEAPPAMEDAVPPTE